MKCINLPEVGHEFVSEYNGNNHKYMVVYINKRYYLHHVYSDIKLVPIYDSAWSLIYNETVLASWFNEPASLRYNGEPVFEVEPTYTLCEKYRGIILRDNSGETHIITSSYSSWSGKPSYSLFRYAHNNNGYNIDRNIGGTGTDHLHDSLLLSLDLEKSDGGKLE